MTEKDTATLTSLVAGCRAQMESDLVELVEELGLGLLQDVTERTATAHEPERRVSAGVLRMAMAANWGKVAPALKAALPCTSSPPWPS